MMLRLVPNDALHSEMTLFLIRMIFCEVCDKHFKAEDFKEPLHKSIGRTYRSLKDGVIPSVFPSSNADKTAEDIPTVMSSHRGRRCAVPDCSHYKRFAPCGPGAGFQFPTDPEVRQRWIEAVRRHISLHLVDDGTEWEPPKHAKMCAAHFRKEDFKV